MRSDSDDRSRGQGVPFERVRRITGYLVGTLKRFNNAKRAEDCVFWQDGFWQSGLRGFVVDLANWIGWCFNRRDWNPLHWLLPGVCRGLTASQKGKVSASRCWTNRWWIRLQGHRGPRMSKREALALMAELEGRLL